MSYKSQSYANTAETLIKNLKKRNMEGFYCPTAESAVEKIRELIPETSSVTWGGSETLVEAGILKGLQGCGYELIDRMSAKTPEEKRALYGKIVMADYFLMSSNAITIDGELINIDGAGNRVACLCHGPRHVVITAGMNKVVKTIEDGVHRVRNAAAPPNSLRVGVKTPCSVTGTCQDCLSDGCICSDLVITRRSMVPGRIKVVLIGEDYGF